MSGARTNPACCRRRSNRASPSDIWGLISATGNGGLCRQRLPWGKPRKRSLTRSEPDTPGAFELASSRLRFGRAAAQSAAVRTPNDKRAKLTLALSVW